jgi:hypothetical protein
MGAVRLRWRGLGRWGGSGSIRGPGCGTFPAPDRGGCGITSARAESRTHPPRKNRAGGGGHARPGPGPGGPGSAARDTGHFQHRIVMGVALHPLEPSQGPTHHEKTGWRGGAGWCGTGSEVRSPAVTTGPPVGGAGVRRPRPGRPPAWLFPGPLSHTHRHTSLGSPQPDHTHRQTPPQLVKIKPLTGRH